MVNSFVRRGGLPGVVVLAVSGVVFAAEPIALEVRVTGREATPTDLTAADFQLREDGKAQDVDVAFVGPDGPGNGQPKLWLYIALDIGPTNYPHAEAAIRKYLDEIHQPGVVVSLGGSPFTDNVAELKEVLSPSFSPETAEIPGQRVPGLLAFWKVGTGALLSGRPMLDRYTLLTRQLGVLPGKKVVVMFREGLRLDRDGLDTGNAPSAELGAGGRGNDRLASTLGSNDASPMQFVESFDRLASEALRNRVSFYPVHPRAEDLGGLGSQGLNQLANRTGGEPLLSQGDPSAIFREVLEDAGGYYLLTYEPSDDRQRGRKRRINVRLNRKGFRADALGEYMEYKPGEQAPPQRAAAGSGAGQAPLTVDDAAMKELLSGAARQDFPLEASHAVFRGEDGRATVLYTLGVHPSELQTSESRGSTEADITVGAMALDGDGEAGYAGVREKRTFPTKQFQNALKGERMRTTCSGELLGLSPGRYKLVVGWKDETSGEASTVEMPLSVPDFSGALAASSLFLTRDAAQGPPPANAVHGDLLTAGDTHFLPDPGTRYAAGETVFILYHLYNVPDELLRQPPPVQFVVLSKGAPVANAPAGGDPVVMQALKQIRYRVMLQTDQLSAGTYTAMVGVPQAGNPQPRVLTKEFVIE
jgi:hypothetical protein